ncbi:uncharacterized protein LOC141607894 [Silene latifolia]|uniref:uncharacterized protein LOC141607894 n=1 Tax=Silene latifolia TaxID=37657 RepID=UPI003D782FD6
MFQVVKKLKRLKVPLKHLNSEGYGDIENTAKVAKLLLDNIQRNLHGDPTNEVIQAEERVAVQTFRELEEARIAFLEQKAKAKKAQNKVLSIKDSNGLVCNDSSAIEQAFIAYYKDLLGSSTSVTSICFEVVRRGKTVSREHARQMVQEVTYDEIKEALFSIPVEKASGPDGYSSGFFHDAYEIVGEDIVHAVQELAGVLTEIISMNQSAFIRDREIVDNILICQDLARLYSRKSCSPRVMMKVDIRKAYDTIVWNFVGDMLEALRFPSQMVNWILKCVTTTSFTLSLNRSNFWAMKLNHLAFADELLLFAKISRISGFQRGTLPFRYLGISISHKILSNAVCSKLVDKIVAKVRGWGTKHLSYAGRLVIVKSVLTQMHSYWVRIFLLPKGVIHKVDSICRNYLWAGSDEYRHAPPVALETCCLPCDKGGLGISNCHLRNIAVLGKYSWWISQLKDSLWVKWVHTIYIKQQDWWQYQPSINSSWT